ncbi:MAG: hypothetical protein SFY80_08590 [Verrucomicrobiota bacterium]|nr:hypothetical protein [Verrucomicrobiota bacterium]
MNKMTESNEISSTIIDSLGRRIYKAITEKRSFFLCVISLILLLPVYILWKHHSEERMFYMWDYALYHFNALSLYNYSHEGWHSVWNHLLNSFNDDYNVLFAVPLLPIIYIFGDDRFVFILGLYFVYFIPFSIFFTLHLRKLFLINNKWSLIGILLCILLIPSLWEPLLSATPDIGGLALLLLATMVYYNDINLNKRMTYLLIPLSTALSMLLRRQYFVDFLAFHFIFILLAAIDNFKDFKCGKISWTKLLPWKHSLITMLSVIIIIALSPNFLPRAYWMFFNNIYASFDHTHLSVASFYIRSIGGCVLFLSTVGLVCSVRQLTMSLRGRFSIVFFGIVFLNWFLREKSISSQHGLHLHLLIITGLIALYVYITRLTKRKTLTLILFWTFLIINFTQAYPDIFPVSTINTKVPFFSKSIIAEKRSDYDEVMRLVQYLREQQPVPKSILLAGASFDFNSAAFSDAEVQQYGRKSTFLWYMYQPWVDSRDNLALAPLANADYVLLAEPYQGTEETYILKIYYDSVIQGLEKGRYKLHPTTFTLRYGVTVRVYQRIMDYTEGELLTISDRIVSKIYSRYPNQNRWCPLRSDGRTCSWPSQDGRLYWNLEINASMEGVASIAYLGPVTSSAKLQIGIDKCSDPRVSVRFTFKSITGDTLDEQFLKDPISGATLQWSPPTDQIGIIVEMQASSSYLLSTSLDMTVTYAWDVATQLHAKTIVQPLTETPVAATNDLFSKISPNPPATRLKDATIWGCTESGSKEQLISFGPYWTVQEGRYKVRYSLKLLPKERGEIRIRAAGYIVATNQVYGEAKQSVNAEANVPQEVELSFEFTIPKGQVVKNLEFYVLVTGHTEYTITNAIMESL